jgi:hypothetical protein
MAFHSSTVPAVRVTKRKPGAVMLAKKDGNPMLPFSVECASVLDSRKLGPAANTEAVHTSTIHSCRRCIVAMR